MSKSTINAAQAKIQSALNAANGRRRERTVGYSEAVQAIREALRDGYGYARGGTVANNYGYASYQTEVGALAAEQAVIVRVGVGRASKGSGLPLPWRRGTADEKIQAIILDSVWTPPRKNEIRISRRDAKALVAAEDHIDALKAVERIPAEYRNSELLVSAADSLAAGNCESETHRVQSWFPGREFVPAREVLAAIVRSAPSLVSFAVRAIKHAERRSLVAV